MFVFLTTFLHKFPFGGNALFVECILETMNLTISFNSQFLTMMKKSKSDTGHSAFAILAIFIVYGLKWPGRSLDGSMDYLGEWKPIQPSSVLISLTCLTFASLSGMVLLCPKMYLLLLLLFLLKC